MLLLTMLVVGSEQREYIASNSPVGGLDARRRVRPDARGDRHRPWLDVDLLRITLPFFVRSRDVYKLFGVRPRSLPELARKGWQAALVLHVEEQLGRTIRVRSHDHLLGGVGMMLDMRRSLRPAGMAGMHFKSASVERNKIVHFVQLMNLGA